MASKSNYSRKYQLGNFCSSSTLVACVDKNSSSNFNAYSEAINIRRNTAERNLQSNTQVLHKISLIDNINIDYILD